MNGTIDRGDPCGTRTTLFVDRPDGTATEIVHHDSGRITVTRFERGGAVAARFAIAIRPGGGVSVQKQAADGASNVMSPASIERQTNPYGLTIERLDYDGVVLVVNSFDDEGRFRSVSVQGDWGEHELELRPDGARTMRWENPFHHGVKAWDAAGRLDHYQVGFSDDTRYRWDRVGETGRASVTGWDGSAAVVHNADPPPSEEADP
ncbi:MAG: hypothetical protein GY925_08105 [Actinomycetia bacterium]|nr:hypothetical protein [Actinomycetes bacterium]